MAFTTQRHPHPEEVEDVYDSWHRRAQRGKAPAIIEALQRNQAVTSQAGHQWQNLCRYEWPLIP